MNFSAYLSLTKPRISVLFAITGLAALLVEGSLRDKPATLWLVVLAIFLTGGSANAFNQYFEREVDKKMARTAKKRALPSGKLSPNQALAFSVITGIVGTWILLAWGGLMAALLGVITILFYSFYYTIVLKSLTPYNIVIGGAAGATGPLIGWAAATGFVDWAPLIMFLIVFVWTPPHFWALAICCREDYKAVSYPMLPLVIGDDKTRNQILFYSYLLLPVSLSLYFIGKAGLIYLISASILGVLFIIGAHRVHALKTDRVSWQFFAYSIIYLLLLYIMMMVDAAVA